MASNCTRMQDFLTAVTEAEAAAATAKSKYEAAQDAYRCAYEPINWKDYYVALDDPVRKKCFAASDAAELRHDEARDAALAATEANAALGRYVYGLTQGKERT